MPPSNPLPTVTALPLPLPIPLAADLGPTRTAPDLLVERDSIVTVSVVASAGPTSAAAGKSSSTFPFAVAIPALVGGMALAVLGFGLYWWISKKRKREKRERYERAQRRRNRKRANSAATRPSMSSSRNVSGSDVKTLATEKQFIPPVPALPKHAHSNPNDPYTQSEKGYGYATPAQPQNGQNQYSTPPVYNNTQTHPNLYHPNSQPASNQSQYQPQPTIEPPIHAENLHSSGIPSSDSSDSTTPLNSEQDEFVSKSSILPSRPSRSATRMAAAESAAANASADPIARYQPKKPSPLALKAAEEQRARQAQMQGYAHEPFRNLDTNAQETLAPSSAGAGGYLAPSDDGHASTRSVSGEWGVALGSPTNDPSFSFTQQQQSFGNSSQSKSRYSNDPYLSASAQAQNRAPSGQYTVDPYASYHSGEMNDQYSKLASSKKTTWV